VEEGLYRCGNKSDETVRGGGRYNSGGGTENLRRTDGERTPQRGKMEGDRSSWSVIKREHGGKVVEFRARAKCCFWGGEW